MSHIDKAFVETNVELEVMDDNPPTDLQRFEFLEIILRIAGMKFFDNGDCESFKDSLQKLLDENIFQIEFDCEWQEFRDLKLWTLDVDDLFKANSAYLQDLY